MISEFPLFVFTTLGGLAAGTYVMAVFFDEKDKVERPWLLPLVCIVLLGAGLLGVLGHLGRPERFLLALSNPSSMIAQEAYWAIALGVLLLIDAVFRFKKGTSPIVVRVLGAIAAFGLMCIMANAYFTSYGNPVWTAWSTLVLFVIGDLAMGAALLALFKKQPYQHMPFLVTCVALEAFLAVGLIAVAARFGAYSYAVAPFVVALVVSVIVGIVAGFLTRKEVLPQRLGSIVVFACVFVGVALARYFFYAAVIV